jgi:hypothetical protein
MSTAHADARGVTAQLAWACFFGSAMWPALAAGNVADRLGHDRPDCARDHRGHLWVGCSLGEWWLEPDGLRRPMHPVVRLVAGQGR